MDRKLTFACARARRVARARRHGGDCRYRARRIRPRRDSELDPPRRNGAAHRAVASQYAAIARGADAYFKYLNATRRDQRPQDHLQGTSTTHRSPPRALPLTRQLVEQDKVFAVFNSLGTAHNLAVRPYLNAMKVPQLFVASGATTWGRDYAQYPVHDRLPAELSGRGMGLRQVPRAHRPRCHDRRPVPERRLRQGPPRRAQARPPAVEGEGDRRPAVRSITSPDVVVADGEAEVVGGRHPGDLRHSDVAIQAFQAAATSSAGSRSA